MNNKTILWTIVFILLISSVFAVDSLVITSSGTNNDPIGYYDGTNKREAAAQSFVISGTGKYEIPYIKFYVYKQGSPTDNLAIEIQTDNAGSPSGTAITGGSSTIAGAGMSLASTEEQWDYTGTELDKGTTYWLVLKRSGTLESSNFYKITRNSDSDDYTDGSIMEDWDDDGFLALNNYDYKGTIYYNNIIATPDNFTIQINDSYNASILNVSVMLDYNGTTTYFNGTSIDAQISDDTILANITISKDGYDTLYYENYNISTNIADSMNLTYGRVVFNSSLKSTIDASTISNYTVTAVSLTTDLEYSGSTTTEDLILNIPKNDTYQLSIYPYKYAKYDINITYNDFINLTMPNLYFYRLNSINVTFYDEETLTIINNETIDIDLISSVFSGNYTTGTGNLTLDILSPTTYTIRYSSTAYTERFHYFTLINNTHTDIDLYMLKSAASTQRTINIVDQNANTVEGATVKALKYDINTNSYIQVAEDKTDINGQVVMGLTTDEYHKFVIEYNGITLKTTNPTYLIQTAYTIQVVIGDAVNTDYLNYRTLDYTFSFTDSTNNFKLNYNDVSGFTNSICVYVYTITAQEQTLFNSSCLSTSSGTILIGVIEENGTTYRGDVYYSEDDGNNTFLTSAYKEFNGKPDLGDLGLFLQILLTIIIAAITVWSLPVMVIALPASLIFGHLLALNSISITALIGIQVVGVFIAMILQKRT